MNVIEISNFALGLAGEKSIRGFPPTEDSVLSRLVETIAIPVIRGLIAENQWSFAIREADLVEVSGETSSLGDYVYALPVGCLRVWDLLPEGRYDTEWRIIGDRLISSVESPTVLYTLEDSVEGPFPVWFALCAAQHIAPVLALNRNKVDKVHILNNAARLSKASALVTDLNQRNRIGRKESPRSDTFVKGR